LRGHLRLWAWNSEKTPSEPGDFYLCEMLICGRPYASEDSDGFQSHRELPQFAVNANTKSIMKHFSSEFGASDRDQKLQAQENTLTDEAAGPN
jgi:hypothetical protein